ncbi:MAG: protein phosphatase 2C domain-containing protein [Gammaproteobacteria bacterium]|nr:protein phosphatase 2C domain-containing protein [Gammaproteobacteria bacterium]MBU1655404.1 protein phosphatase 2C domain-containing protein [Gammaproteobacteria bacterium]MBU1960812.1 protein phosphatase 2C domain-containing protein [Gammaproteobacteria bacterium]
MIFQITFSQHCGNNPGQQDALWNGESVFQQRNLIPKQRWVASSDPVVVAVADGVANSPMPHKASRCVLDLLAAEVAAGAAVDARLVRRVHGLLCNALSKGKTRGSSTTLALAGCRNDRCKILSVGDSRVYRIAADGKWEQLSRDHSLLNTLIDQGEADADEAYASFYNLLDSCLVADDEETEFPICCVESPFLEGDALLLCTDGVHDTLGDLRLQQLMAQGLDPLAQVVRWREAIFAAGAPDNFSLIFVRRGE